MIVKLKLVIHLILYFSISQLSSQENLLEKLILPEPINGYNSIQDSLIFPEIPRMAGIESAFRAVLNIDTSGTVTKMAFKPMFRTTLYPIDSVYISTVRSRLNKIQWKPAKLNGEIIECGICIPFIFIFTHSEERLYHQLGRIPKSFSDLELNPIIIKTQSSYIYNN